MREKLALTAMLGLVAGMSGYAVNGDMAEPPRKRREPEEDRLRRELAETHGHQERLRAAADKRARKAAKRAKDAGYNASLSGGRRRVEP